VSYDSWFLHNFSGLVVDLNLWGGAAENQIFTTGTAAFTGAAAGNLTAYGAVLPSPGSRGDIVVGLSGVGSNAKIGEWSVVPEPRQYAMIAGLGLVGFGLWRRRANR
jgi:hypothetical protein